MHAVPVFLYHSVCDDPPSWIAPYTVTPHAFTEHLARIADSGVTIVPMRRLVASQRGGPVLPPHCAVLTFDDGFADFYWTVAPLLADHELSATLYVTTGAVHVPGGRAAGSLLPPAVMLNWRQILTLDACGIEIGGHSRTHAQLDTLRERQLCDEVAGCKRDLEEVLAHPAATFAYPHGYSRPAVHRQVQRAGWISACGLGQAFSSSADNPLQIARLTVRADTPLELLSSWAVGSGAPVAPCPEPWPSKGSRAYRRARATFGRLVRRNGG